LNVGVVVVVVVVVELPGFAVGQGNGTSSTPCVRNAAKNLTSSDFFAKMRICHFKYVNSGSRKSSDNAAANHILGVVEFV